MATFFFLVIILYIILLTVRKRRRNKTAKILERILALITGIGIIPTTLAVTDLASEFKALIIGTVEILVAVYIAYSFVHTPLDETLFYSPVHAMINQVNTKIKSDATPVGIWISDSLIKIDVPPISEAFHKNAAKTRFTDKDTDMWDTMEKELRGQEGFWLDKDRQEWFNSLEKRFNR
jgi:hypothetical protein